MRSLDVGFGTEWRGGMRVSPRVLEPAGGVEV